MIIYTQVITKGGELVVKSSVIDNKVWIAGEQTGDIEAATTKGSIYVEDTPSGSHSIIRPDGTYRLSAEDLEAMYAAPSAQKDIYAEAKRWVHDETYDIPIKSKPIEATTTQEKTHTTERVLERIDGAIPMGAAPEISLQETGTITDVLQQITDDEAEHASVDAAFKEGQVLLRKRDAEEAARREIRKPLTAEQLARINQVAVKPEPKAEDFKDFWSRDPELARAMEKAQKRAERWAEIRNKARELVYERVGSIAVMAVMGVGALAGHFGIGPLARAAEATEKLPIIEEEVEVPTTVTTIGHLATTTTLATEGSTVNLDIESGTAIVEAPAPEAAVSTNSAEAPTGAQSREVRSIPGINIENIGVIKEGVDPERIQRAMYHMINVHGATPIAASLLGGNFLQESSLDPDAYNSNEHAFSLLQYQGGRENGLPNNSVLEDHIDYVFEEMGEKFRAIMTSSNDPNTLETAIYNLVRWGHTGERWTFGYAIYAAITS